MDPHYHLDLLTLLVADLPRSEDFYLSHLGWAAIARSTVPHELALRLSQTGLSGRPCAGLGNTGDGMIQLRLIAFPAQARAQHGASLARGWGQMCFVTNTSNGSATRELSDPDGHCLFLQYADAVADDSMRRTHWHAATIASCAPHDALAFYQGLLGAHLASPSPQTGQEHVLALSPAASAQCLSFRLIAPGIATAIARPFAVRLRRVVAGRNPVDGGQTDPQSWLAPTRRLSGPEDEILELL